MKVNLKINFFNVRFEKIVVKKDDYLLIKMLEMCICGRLNVGKFFFINVVFKDKFVKVGLILG